MITFILALALASEFKDDLNRQVNLTAKRVVSLSPAITEIIYKLNLDSNLVGVSDFSDYPEQAKNIPSVGPYTKPSIEKIISLKPELVLLSIEGPDEIKNQLERFHISYAVISMKTLNDVGRVARSIAQWLGKSQKGTNFQKNWNLKLAQIFKGVKKPKAPPQVLIEIQNAPLIAAGGETFLNEILEKCGGQNAFGDQKGYPKIPRELLAVRKIDLTLLADHFSSKREKAAAIAAWRSNPLTKNVKVEELHPDTIARPGPRLIDGIKEICATIEKFAHD